MRELEPRPREEVMKYAIPADHFPVSFGGYVSSGYVAQMASSVSTPVPPAPVFAPSSEPASAPASTKTSAYVPPHMRGKTQSTNNVAVPEHHVATKAEVKPAESRYVPPHLRKKDTNVVATITTTTTTTPTKKLNANDFPALGGGAQTAQKSSATSKMTPWAKKSFATIASLPEPESPKEDNSIYTESKRMYRDGMEVLVMQRQNHGVAKFNQYIARSNAIIVDDESESDEEPMHQNFNHHSDDDDDVNYDDEDAENDKYYS